MLYLVRFLSGQTHDLLRSVQSQSGRYLRLHIVENPHIVINHCIFTMLDRIAHGRSRLFQQGGGPFSNQPSRFDFLLDLLDLVDMLLYLVELGLQKRVVGLLGFGQSFKRKCKKKQMPGWRPRLF